MEPLKIKTTGLSLLEVREKYPDCFFKQTWYDNQPFAKEKPPAGEWEFDFESKLINKTYDEQKSALKKGFDVPHPAILAEALCVHFKETGERMLKDWYSSTSSLDSVGFPSVVGLFGELGLLVSNWLGHRIGNVGCGASRKLDDGSLGPLESLPDVLEINGQKYKKI